MHLFDKTLGLKVKNLTLCPKILEGFEQPTHFRHLIVDFDKNINLNDIFFLF